MRPYGRVSLQDVVTYVICIVIQVERNVLLTSCVATFSGVTNQTGTAYESENLVNTQSLSLLLKNTHGFTFMLVYLQTF